MKLTPVELRGVEFKKVIRGVDSKEVKFYIDQAADALEELLLENKELSERVEKYEKLESVIRDAALQSQELKKTQEEQAKKGAELIIKEARLEADKIKGRLYELRNERAHFFVEFKALLTSYLSIIEKEPKPSAKKEQKIPEPEKTSSTVETVKETPPSVEAKQEVPEPEKALPVVEKEEKTFNPEEALPTVEKKEEKEKEVSKPEKISPSIEVKQEASENKELLESTKETELDKEFVNSVYHDSSVKTENVESAVNKKTAIDEIQIND